ncbi:MAG TPA: heme exporter protein CcmD [Rhodospirillales bacterium]|jgi:heme exporter protein D|nr:heme exporter protein CcmD [Rhodospirillales bacterium]
MDAIMEFFNMGGYGAFIWPSYLVSALVMVVMLVVSLRLLRANQAMLKVLEATSGEKAGEEKT